MKESLVDAIKQSNQKLLRKLLVAGESVNAIDAKGNTPLMVATMERDLDSLHMLLEFGADPNLVNHAGKTAYDLALETGDRLIANVLAPVTFEPYSVQTVVTDAFTTLFGDSGPKLEKLIKGRKKNKAKIKKALDQYSSLQKQERPPQQEDGFSPLTPMKKKTKGR